MLSNLNKLKNEKSYIKSIIANLISTFGSSIDNIAFSWLVYQITENATWIAIIFGSSMLPMLLQSFIAVWVERHDKQKIIILSDIMGAGIMILVVTLFYANLLNPFLLLFITLVNALIETVRIPAGIAFVPMILSEENYEVGTGINQSMGQIASLVGLALTGVIIAVGGVGLAMIIDMGTFIISAIIISTIKYTNKIEKITHEKPNFIKEFKEGWSVLKNSPKIITICIIGIGLNFLAIAVSTYSAIYVGDYLKFSASIYGYVSVTSSVGLAIGGLISAFVCAKISSRKLFFITTTYQALFHIIAVVCIYIENPFVKITVLFANILIYGISSGIIGVKVSVIFIKAVPKEFLARMAGIFNSLVTVASPLASIILTIMSLRFGVDIIFIVFGILAFIFALIIFLNKKLKFDDGVETNEKTL